MHELGNKENTIGRKDDKTNGRKKIPCICIEEKTIKRKGRSREKNMSQFAVR